MSRCRGKVLVTGSGTSGAVAIRAAHLLSVGGTPAFYLSPADGLHGGLGVLRPGDIVLALSKSGGSDELNEFCNRGRALCGCLLVITASPGSTFPRRDIRHLSPLPQRQTRCSEGSRGKSHAFGPAERAGRKPARRFCKRGRTKQHGLARGPNASLARARHNGGKSMYTQAHRSALTGAGLLALSDCARRSCLSGGEAAGKL